MTKDTKQTVHYEDGDISLDILLSPEEGTAWLTGDQIAILFNRVRSAISKQIKTAQNEGKISGGTSVKKIHGSAQNSKYRPPLYYNLDVVLEIGQRLKSDMGQRLASWVYGYLGINSQNTEIIIYDNEGVEIEVRVSPEEETIWLTQIQIATLFEVTQQTVSFHIKCILNEGELDNSVHKYYLYTALDGKQYKTTFYNLDMILSVGYRVRSKKATEFRKWANSVLKRYLTKGYALNENHLSSTKQALSELSIKVISLDEKLDRTSDALGERITKLEEIASRGDLPSEAIFFKGSFFDAREFFQSLIVKVKERIIVIDPYADAKLLSLLKYHNGPIAIHIIKSSYAKLNDDDVMAFSLQYGPIDVSISEDFHDRFLILDQDCYCVGASFNHQGNKTFAVMKMEDPVLIASIVERVKACSRIE